MRIIFQESQLEFKVSVSDDIMPQMNFSNLSRVLSTGDGGTRWIMRCHSMH
jgi:hypothetical protein